MDDGSKHATVKEIADLAIIVALLAEMLGQRARLDDVMRDRFPADPAALGGSSSSIVNTIRGQWAQLDRMMGLVRLPPQGSAD
jgi:hypothetical protein